MQCADVDPNSAKSSGLTPCYVAAQSNYAEVVRALLQHPSLDPGRLCKGTSPLFVAACRYALGVVLQRWHVGTSCRPWVSRFIPLCSCWVARPSAVNDLAFANALPSAVACLLPTGDCQPPLRRGLIVNRSTVLRCWLIVHPRQGARSISHCLAGNRRRPATDGMPISHAFAAASAAGSSVLSSFSVCVPVVVAGHGQPCGVPVEVQDRNTASHPLGSPREPEAEGSRCRDKAQDCGWFIPFMRRREGSRKSAQLTGPLALKAREGKFC